MFYHCPVHFVERIESDTCKNIILSCDNTKLKLKYSSAKIVNRNRTNRNDTESHVGPFEKTVSDLIIGVISKDIKTR